jgi:hypothetical protein
VTAASTEVARKKLEPLIPVIYGPIYTSTKLPAGILDTFQIKFTPEFRHGMDPLVQLASDKDVIVAEKKPRKGLFPLDRLPDLIQVRL